MGGITGEAGQVHGGNSGVLTGDAKETVIVHVEGPHWMRTVGQVGQAGEG